MKINIRIKPDKFFSFFSISATAIALTALLGHLTGWTILASIRSKYTPMPIIPAIKFSILGIIIYSFKKISSTKWSYIIFGFLIAVIILGCIVLLDTMINIVPDNIESPYIAVFFIFFSLSIFLKLILREKVSINNLLIIIGILLAYFGFTIILAYFIGAPLMYKYKMLPVAINGGVCVVLLSLALIGICNKDATILGNFVGDSPNAKIQRRIVPLIFFATLFGSLLFIFSSQIKNVSYAIIVAGEIAVISLISIIVVHRSTETIFCEATKTYEVNKENNLKIIELNNSLEKKICDRTTQLTALNNELLAFSYSVSHDLRSPLRGIDGWSLALYEDYSSKLDSKGTGYIETIRKETQRMGSLIDDLIKLSHLTQVDLKISTVDLSKLALTIAERLKGIIPGRKLDIIIEPGLTVTGDPGLLEIVLNNLFENSYKFTGPRENAIIEFGIDKRKEGKVFYIKDNGVGFDMVYADKMFGAFQRMHKHSEFPGTGIGLATVRRIFNRLEGHVWAESEVDKGTTIYFSMK